MRRALGLVLGGLLTLVGLQTLADATQNRPDPPQPAGVTEVTLEVRTKDPYPAALAAESLWAACRHTVRATRLTEPLQAAVEGRFVLTLRPALGPHATRRLFGCLQDATIDGVSGRVVDRDDKAAAMGSMRFPACRAGGRRSGPGCEGDMA